ncbi:phage shock envelope stress response protein PspM [Saccharopolyspora taberi]|uniref:Uncharacterized protein n=1 Tax=Saccharopolyspora taberi TaxID=60895 RepID=A0ABN3V9Y3_9PSEU
MKRGRNELAELGEAALEHLRGPGLSSVRRLVAKWRDPRARLIRQRNRARRATIGGAVTTGVLGVSSYGSYALDAMWSAGGAIGEVAQQGAVFGLGGLAVATGAATVGAGVRYRRLKRTPLPEPPPPSVELPPVGSQAREPMQRLRDAERGLHGALAQLASTGSGSEVADARATAEQTAVALRQVADRLQAVEAAMPHVAAADRDALTADVRRLRAELDEGVEGYGGLVAAAGRAVAASGAPEQKHLIQDATDRLAGLAEGLREMSGPGRVADLTDPRSVRREGPGQPA